MPFHLVGVLTLSAKAVLLWAVILIKPAFIIFAQAHISVKNLQKAYLYALFLMFAGVMRSLIGYEKYDYTCLGITATKKDTG